MCGIAGIYTRGDAPPAEARLRAMQDDLLHRGPDDSGLHLAPHVGLAFRRLAIIDLSPQANQPMASDDGRTWIVFNGEIYNYRDLRRDLERAGRPFRTQSDTEVLLRGYEAWGTDVFRRLNGMFAAGLWDGDREELVLVRDRVGKKPLYYRDAGGEVCFASEVRALVAGLTGAPPVDPEALDLYLTYLCVPGDRSIYAGVRKVPPASILTFSRGGARLARYWRISFREKEAVSAGEAGERLEAILTDATRIRMISDVPLGAFLSGGVDSSTVVALMSRLAGPVRTFSIGLTQADLDELPFAREVASACGTRHEEIVVEADAAAILPRLVWHYGEPFADCSAVPTYYVSQAARRAVTVALNGDGGDEGFAGYQWHRSIRAAETYRRLVPGPLRRWLVAPLFGGLSRLRSAPAPLVSLARLLSHWGGRPPAEVFWIWQGFSREDRQHLYEPAFLERLGGFDPSLYSRRAYANGDGRDDLDRALQVGLETYLPDDLLVKVDIASMANSLEARSPLLDYRVLEFAARLPASLKVRGLQTKFLLKSLAARLVPPRVVHRRKRGFTIPLDAWLRGPLAAPLRALLTHPRFFARGYVRREAVQALLDRHAGGEDHSERLWALLWLELWFRMFVDRDLRKEDSLKDVSREPQAAGFAARGAAIP